MTPEPETWESLLIRVRDPADVAAWQEFVSIYRPMIYRPLPEELVLSRPRRYLRRWLIPAAVVCMGIAVGVLVDQQSGQLDKSSIHPIPPAANGATLVHPSKTSDNQPASRNMFQKIEASLTEVDRDLDLNVGRSLLAVFLEDSTGRSAHRTVFPIKVIYRRQH